MNKWVDWFAENKVAANIIMLIIILGGATAASAIKMEVFPEFVADRLAISVPYPGAAPEEVEESICIKIEEAIRDLDGVKKIISTASEGVASLTVEVDTGYDPRILLDDVQTSVDAIDTFPDEAEEPVIVEVLTRNKVLNVGVHGNLDELSLKVLSDEIRSELEAVPGLTKIESSGAKDYEVTIELSEESMRRYSLTFQEVADAIRKNSLDLPGGSLKTTGGQILLRTKGQAYVGDDFEKIVIRTEANGTRLLVRDVARVVDGFKDQDLEMRLDGEPMVMVQAFRVGDQSAIDVADKVYDYVEEKQKTLPEGVRLTTFQDDSIILKGRLQLLLDNARWGFLLVFFILALFLEFKLAFWVTLGIPISFMGALWMMPQLDVSLNMISMFAFILVLGIVVDDAIVVGENIFSRMRRGGLKGLKAAQMGAKEVAVPVTFAILTTIMAFMPMMGIPGFMGKIWQVIPLIIIPCLAFSLLECLIILPAHLSNVGLSKENFLSRLFRPISQIWLSFQQRFSYGLENFVKNVYQKWLGRFMEYRYATVSMFFVLFAISVGFLAGGHLKWAFMPDVEADFVLAQVKMPEGATSRMTAQATSHIEKAALRVKEFYEDQGAPVIKHISTVVGESPVQDAMNHGGRSSGASANLGELFLELMPSETRTISSKEVELRWREEIGSLVGIESLLIHSSLARAGDAINIQLEGGELFQLKEAAEILKVELRKEPGVLEPRHSFQAGKQEVKLAIKPEAEAYGLTLEELGRQVRQAFYGEDVQKVQRGRHEVDVVVRYPEEDRRTLNTLEKMRIRTKEGDEVPFSVVAEAYSGQGYSTIKRSNRRRVINVIADMDKTQGNANETLKRMEANILPGLMAQYPGMGYSLEGERKEEDDSLAHMARNGVLALFGIYALIAIVFKSYVQPFIVMSAIPFGFVGAVIGHLLFGMNFSIMSMCGLLALTGVVVNDSLVMVDYVNRRRREGMALKEAVVRSGSDRFRPILLTSLTTFAGLTPLILEKSMQAKFLAPMAVALAFGVLFATFITLILVPGLYIILEDLRQLLRRIADGLNANFGGVKHSVD